MVVLGASVLFGLSSAGCETVSEAGSSRSASSVDPRPAVEAKRSGPANDPRAVHEGATPKPDAETGGEQVSARDEPLPPWKPFMSAAAQGPWKRPAPASKRRWLDDDRAVAVVRSERGQGHDASWRIVLVRLKRAGDEWAGDGIAELETWSAHEELGRDGTIAVNLQVEDFDDDGAQEIRSRHRLAWMCCGAGATEKRTLVMTNDDAILSEAAYLDLDAVIYRGATRGRERYEDRNGDGHRDLVVEWVMTDEEDPTERGEDVHVWQSARDRYERARRPRGEDCYCE
jgi:hypothetical protein